MDKYVNYLKAAFFNQWHLLALGAVTAFAMVGPMRDVTFPLLMAGEMAFMAVICHNPRFQRIVDAKVGAVNEAQQLEVSQKRFEKLYYSLDGDTRIQFDRLRERCEVINNAAVTTGATESISDWQAAGVNKLLWVYLKLLNTRMNINKFLQNIDQKSFDRMEKEAKERLKTMGDDPAKEKMRRSIEDTLQTIDTRKKNLLKAKDNLDYINLELDRITAKLTTLSEMAVNRQDPASLSNEVDDVTKSVQSTEQAIGELNMFAGLPMDEEVAPPMIARKSDRRIRI